MCFVGGGGGGSGRFVGRVEVGHAVVVSLMACFYSRLVGVYVVVVG
jgi:hypothetical protein